MIYQDTADNGVVLPKSIVYDAWKAGPSVNVLEEMVSLIKKGEWYLLSFISTCWMDDCLKPAFSTLPTFFFFCRLPSYSG